MTRAGATPPRRPPVGRRTAARAPPARATSCWTRSSASVEERRAASWRATPRSYRAIVCSSGWPPASSSATVRWSSASASSKVEGRRVRSGAGVAGRRSSRSRARSSSATEGYARSLNRRTAASSTVAASVAAPRGRGGGRCRPGASAGSGRSPRRRGGGRSRSRARGSPADRARRGQTRSRPARPATGRSGSRAQGVLAARDALLGGAGAGDPGERRPGRAVEQQAGALARLGELGRGIEPVEGAPLGGDLAPRRRQPAATQVVEAVAVAPGAQPARRPGPGRRARPPPTASARGRRRRSRRASRPPRARRRTRPAPGGRRPPARRARR